MLSDPVFNVKEVDVFTLKANDWNPNVVFNKELELLEQSILLSGWIQPIIINPNKIIIDGFHRCHLAKSSQKIQERDSGLVPCVELDLSDRDAMMMTVRINRAKGTHAALKMSDLVQRLVDDYEVTPDEMIEKMGMTQGEVGLLYDGSLLKSKKLQDWQYSKAWKPVETRNEEAQVEFERSQEDDS